MFTDMFRNLFIKQNIILRIEEPISINSSFKNENNKNEHKDRLNENILGFIQQ